MRVTEKGQVTIPKPVRDRLGIVPGSEVDFIEDEDGVRVVKAESHSKGGTAGFDGWLKSVQGIADTEGMDGKDYVDWLRGARDDIDAG